MTWIPFLQLGDIKLTLALAAGISAWLLTARAWRMAFWWSLLFGLGIGLVTASKVAFMAWGMSLHDLEFKAISGHATGVTAVFPTLLYLLLQPRGARAQVGGIVAGLALGGLMVILLVAENEHSLAEALVGWFTGAAVSLGAVHMARGQPDSRALPLGVLCAMLVFASAAWVMHEVPYGYLMARTAVLISGNSPPVQWCTGS
jgi:hypothetical protein